MIEVQTCTINIFIAGDASDARRICRKQCMEIGLCVTVTPTEFIYTGGAEAGVCVGLVNYPRFPSTADELWQKARHIAEALRIGLCQWSYLLVGPDKSEWVSNRPEDVSHTPQMGTE